MINPYKTVIDFEEAIADYCGSKYAVAVESCSAAIFLSLMYMKELHGEIGTVVIPKRTYPSVPCSIIHAGGKVKFTDDEWVSIYNLAPYNIWDCALKFHRGMYAKGSIQCLSFHVKKLIPVGRGGAILTDDQEAYEWFKRARFDGRGPVPLQEDNITMLGWNCYMQPSDAARGLQLLQALGDRELPDLKVEDQKYSDLSIQPAYQKYITTEQQVKVQDKFVYRGKEWTVFSVNYIDRTADLATTGEKSMTLGFDDEVLAKYQIKL